MEPTNSTRILLSLNMRVEQSNSIPGPEQPTASGAGRAVQPARPAASATQGHEVSSVGSLSSLKDVQLVIQMDKDAKIVVTVVDSATGQVLRRIPSEEMQRVSSAIAAWLERQNAPGVIPR